MKKTNLIAITAGAAAVLIFIAVALYLNITPKLKLKSRLDELINETYTYSVDYSMKGMDFGILGDELEGNICGSKGVDILYGDISNNGYDYLELYVDSQAQMIFNVEPLFDSIVEAVEEKTGLSLSLVKLYIGDLNISKEQIEEVTGKEIFDLSESLSGKNAEWAAYALQRIKDTDDIDKLLGDDALYFSISMEDGSSYLIIGIPKSEDEKKISVEIFYGEAVAKFVGTYEPGDVPDMEMPQPTMSDSTIAVLHEIYAYWMELQEN